MTVYEREKEIVKKMIKKTVTKEYDNYDSRGGIELPYITDMDTLSYSNDDEIMRRAGNLYSDREKAGRLGYDMTPWEVELSYVQREMKIRNDRRLAHEAYIRLNPEAANFVDGYADENSFQHLDMN